MNFSAGVNNNAIVSGDAGSDLLVFSSTVASSSLDATAVLAVTPTFAGALSGTTVDLGAMMTSPHLAVLSAVVLISTVALEQIHSTSITSQLALLL